MEIPITKKSSTSFHNFSRNLYSRYIPFAGCLSYHLFAFNVYFPRALRGVLPDHHNVVENCLLYNSHIGIGLYLYTRKQMHLLPTYYRVLYSLYGSVVINFGSILLWALTERLLPESRILRSTVALSSALCLVAIGREYLQFVDSSI